MQSINVNITVKPTTPIHIKANYNDEFRRFVLETPSYSYLEQTLRSLYSLGEAQLIKVKFQDDENDWVVISSDEELNYAVALAGSPIRLSVQAVESKELETGNASETFEVSEAPEPSDALNSAPFPTRGRGRGRGKRVAGGPSFQERLNAKCNRLSDRIQTIEDRLSGPNPVNSERQRVLKWRLEQLQNKLAAAQDKKTSLENSLASSGETPAATEAPEDGMRVRGRGRGRGCGRGRGRGRSDFQVETDSTKISQPILNAESARQALLHFEKCKADLKAARKSGSLEAIESCKIALAAAREQRKEGLAILLGPQRAHKRECFLKLKEAQKTGNEEQVKVCQEAFDQAMTELMTVKAEILNSK